MNYAITVERLKGMGTQIETMTKLALAMDREKPAFQAMPPMPDPAAAGGMPPGGMPPGMPPGGDPSMMGGAPPPGVDPNAGTPPQVDPQLLEVIDQLATQMEQLVNAVGTIAQQQQSQQQEFEAMKAQLSAPPAQPAVAEDPAMAAAGGGGGMM